MGGLNNSYVKSYLKTCMAVAKKGIDGREECVNMDTTNLQPLR